MPVDNFSWEDTICFMNKQVVALSFYSEKNLGDDLFILTLLNRYPNAVFYSRIDQRIYPANFFPKNLRIIDTSSFLLRGPLSFERHMCKKDNFCIGSLRFDLNSAPHVLIGGSLFQQKDPNDFSSIDSKQRFLSKNGPNVLLGMSFGPWYSGEYLESARKLLKNFAFVSVRDRKTFSLFADLPNVHYFPDIVFSYHKSPVSVAKEKKICISVLGYNSAISKSDNESYISRLKELVSDFVKENYQISILAFCKSEGDFEVADYLYKTCLDKRFVHLYKYENDPDTIISEIASSCLLIGGRFHSIVLAIALGTAFFPVIYHQKIRDLLKDVSFAGNSCTPGDFVFVSEEKILSNMSINNLTNAPLDLEALAEKHFIFLDTLLRK